MAISDFVRTNVSGSITLIDGTSPTPVELTLSFDRGDLVLSGVQKVLNEYQRIQRRGKHVNRAYGNRIYPTISFSAWVTQFQDSGAAPGALLGFLLQTGAYATNESVAGPGDGTTPDIPYATNVRYDLEGTNFGDSADSSLIANDVDWVIDNFTEAAEGLSISVTGTVCGDLAGDWAAAEVA